MPGNGLQIHCVVFFCRTSDQRVGVVFPSPGLPRGIPSCHRYRLRCTGSGPAVLLVTLVNLQYSMSNLAIN